MEFLLYRCPLIQTPAEGSGICLVGGVSKSFSILQALKQALMSVSILAPPDPLLLYILDTDASREGVGTVLSQVWPEGENVVTYLVACSYWVGKSGPL